VGIMSSVCYDEQNCVAFENRGLRGTSVRNKEEKCVMRKLVNCALRKILLGRRIGAVENVARTEIHRVNT
jgi:hypothetical protein